MDKAKIAICPVCEMEVEIESIGRLFKTNYFQHTFYFCSDSCFKIFKKYPEEYIKKRKKRKKKND